MVLPEPARITGFIADVFHRLQIPYFVSGSWASSLHGIPRATQDVDIVADIEPQHITSFVRALEKDFYIDPHMVQDAVQHRSSFNIIHLETMFKADIFLLKDDIASQEEMARREIYELSEEPPQELFLASAEDVILHKLYWFQLGGSVSERLWKDVLGIIQVQADKLDVSYLQRGAELRGVTDLLGEALGNVGIEL